MAMELVSTTHSDRQDFDSSKAVLLVISFPTKHTPQNVLVLFLLQLFEFNYLIIPKNHFEYFVQF